MDEPLPSEAPVVPPARKPYPLIISDHARQRWVERIADPKHYEHLQTCQGCGTCSELLHDLRGAVQAAARYIDREISRRFREARDAGAKVTDISFLEAFVKHHGDISNYDFYESGRAVFVLGKNEKEGEPPVLMTVLSYDMIDGTVIRRCSPTEMKSVFKRWQFEIRQRGRRQ